VCACDCVCVRVYLLWFVRGAFLGWCRARIARTTSALRWRSVSGIRRGRHSQEVCPHAERDPDCYRTSPILTSPVRTYIPPRYLLRRRTTRPPTVCVSLRPCGPFVTGEVPRLSVSSASKAVHQTVTSRHHSQRQRSIHTTASGLTDSFDLLRVI
jgi:hypothetical protein